MFGCLGGMGLGGGRSLARHHEGRKWNFMMSPLPVLTIIDDLSDRTNIYKYIVYIPNIPIRFGC